MIFMHNFSTCMLSSREFNETKNHYIKSATEQVSNFQRQTLFTQGKILFPTELLRWWDQNRLLYIPCSYITLYIPNINNL